MGSLPQNGSKVLQEVELALHLAVREVGDGVDVHLTVFEAIKAIVDH